MISVILALATAQLFLGIAELLQNRTRVQFFVPHGVWLVNLFLITFLHWWSLWTFRGLSWNFGMFFFSLLGPSLMFFATTIINPRGSSQEAIDLEDYFHSIRKTYFTVMIAMLLLFSLDGPIFGTEPPLNGIRAAQATMLAMYIWGLFAESRLSQAIISLVVLGGTSAVVILRFLPGQG